MDERAKRRAHVRFLVRTSAEVLDGLRKLQLTTRNMSIGGCCAETPLKLKTGASLQLHFPLPTEGGAGPVDDVQLTGHVTWVAELPATSSSETRFLAGICFDSPTDEQTTSIERFLTDKERSPASAP